MGKRGWQALTHDWRSRYRDNQRDAVMRAGVRLFILIGHTTTHELAENFINTTHRITAFLERHTLPFIAKIYRPILKERAARSNRPGRVELTALYPRRLYAPGTFPRILDRCSKMSRCWAGICWAVMLSSFRLLFVANTMTKIVLASRTDRNLN